MLSSESVKILVLSFLNINFLSSVAGLYTPETNLGKCFEGTSDGYILLFDRSFVDCVRECKRRPRCQALRYDRRTLICMLYPTDKIPKRDVGGCHQASRGEVINRYALEGKCEEHYTECNINQTCSLNPTTMEPFCEILDCAGRPSRSLPHTEMLHYVDSQVGAQAKIQCYTESLGGSSPWSRAVCTDQGDWYTNIQCKVPQDCTELYDKYNVRESGPHYISPDNRTVVRAFCNMTTEGGWTIIQKRQSNSNFTRNWNEYKAGFGEVTGNYWIGNDALHYLTKRDNILRIQLKPFGGTTKQAKYRNFRVSDESENFRMTYDNYEGSSAVDALGGTLVQFQAKNMPFSTIDRDNDEYPGSCADKMRGGWWYNSCSTSNLNGIYCENGPNCMTWKMNDVSLYGHKETLVMIRRTTN
ncbi:fibroleukin-like isoform X1 [Crassostrea angulata]|uniref:fibroleukin-like isoform X1 n=1 Tax=Magallana angulata TaxID=2784310 RepID=UPI0022B13FB9|nr:fibroleukin-like isoform X1 [Crassostrea angulata]